MATPERHPWSDLPPDLRVIIEVRVGDLFVDRNAQRAIDWEKVAQIAQDLDWNRFELPTVSRMEDGRYRVIEGQHRVLAVQQRDREFLLRVIVIPEEVTTADEAGIALSIATGRKAHKAIDKWELKVRKGFPHEVAAEDVLRQHGLRLGQKPSPTTIGCVGRISKLIHAHRQTPEMGAETLDRVATVIEEAYPREEPDSATTRWNSHLVQAVGELVARNPHLDVSRLALALRDRIARQWITQALQDEASPTWKKIAELVASRYNRGLRAQARRISVEADE